MIRKKAKDTKRKNATRIDSTLIRFAGPSPKMTVWWTRTLRLGMKDQWEWVLEFTLSDKIDSGLVKIAQCCAPLKLWTGGLVSWL